MAKIHLRVVNDLGALVPKSTLRVLNPENPDGDPVVVFSEGVAEVDSKVAKELLAQDLGVTIEEFTPSEDDEAHDAVVVSPTPGADVTPPPSDKVRVWTKKDAKADLQAEAKSLGLDEDGTNQVLADRVNEHYAATAATDPATGETLGE